MKKILFILMMLVCGFASAQVTYLGSATTTQRNTLTIPSGRHPILYNSTTGQFERYNGSSWERWTAGILTGDITDGTIDVLDLDAALQTSVGLADTAVQSSDIDTFTELNAIVADATLLKSGDNISALTNDSGYITSQTDDQVASEVPFTPFGTTAATNVQAAIQELTTEKAGYQLIATLDANGQQITNLSGISFSSGGITSANIVNGAITASKLASGSVGTSQIADGSIGQGDINSASTIIANEVLLFNGSQLDFATIGGANITNGSIDELDLDTSVNASLDLADSATQSTDWDTSAEIAANVTDETGSGALVFATSPTLVTPNLGTPSAATLTNATGLPGTGIVAGSIEVDRLESTNAATDGYFPSYDATSGGVTWESISGTDSGSGYTFNTISTDNNYLTDTDVTAAGSSTGKKIWNRVTTTLDSVWLHKDSLSLQGNPFIIQNWGADSVVVRKGAGTNFYIADSAAVYSRSGIILKQRHPLTVIKMDASSFFLQGNFSPLLTETTVTDMVSASSHDAEESDTGVVTLTSSDIELVWTPDGTTYSQKVGLLFDGLNIPQGATITSAKIQFETKELQTGASPSLVIYGDDSDNAGVFTTATNNVSGRTKTTASVSWSGIAAWGTLNERGANQLTPELKTIVQEIVNRPGYTSASNIAFIIEDTTTSNRRTAKAYDSYPTEAAEITITYQN